MLARVAMDEDNVDMICHVFQPDQYRNGMRLGEGECPSSRTLHIVEYQP